VKLSSALAAVRYRGLDGDNLHAYTYSRSTHSHRYVYICITVIVNTHSGLIVNAIPDSS